MSVFEMDHAFRPHLTQAARDAAALRDMLALADEREALAATLVATAAAVDDGLLDAVELHATHAGWALAGPDDEVTVDVRYALDPARVEVDVTIDRVPGFRWVLLR